jgi:glycerol-3-phosphate dehydrogenase
MSLSRRDVLQKLKSQEPFDLLVIGGGATGCGVALDAASRGLRTALVEKNDFAEGTSGRSTKLLHGGVRYLEMAVKHLDRGQYHLVRDALRERGILLRMAPHLCSILPLVTPLYSWMAVPYILSGLKLYDLLAGSAGIGKSRLLSRPNAMRRCPMLRAKGLKAGVLYFDGQFNDARMAVSLALTAADHGAVTANHVGVKGFIRDGGKIAGVSVRDSVSGESWPVTTRAVINATGPFTDELRKMDDPSVRPMLKISEGIHVVLDSRFTPPEAGLLIPKTEDGRVLFILPWEGHALIGTTDEPAAISEHPVPPKEDVSYLLRHINRYFDLQVSESDIRAVWSGLRPLVFDPGASDTAQLTRDHVLEESPSGLITIAGGKWTTYRKMAEDTVDFALRRFDLKPAGSCRTDRIPLVGGKTFDLEGGPKLAERFGFSAIVAQHLNQAYGDRAGVVAQVAAEGYSDPLARNHPFLEAEVIYGARYELAERTLHRGLWNSWPTSWGGTPPGGRKS